MPANRDSYQRRYIHLPGCRADAPVVIKPTPRQFSETNFGKPRWMQSVDMACGCAA